MKWIQRFAILLFGLVAFAMIGYQLFKKPISSFLFERFVENAILANPVADLDDGLHVFMCGTGSPMADANTAGACIGVLAGQKGYVFDAGSGSIRKLQRMGFPLDKLEHAYITHLHSDHIDGVGELLTLAWIAGRTEPLPVSGPTGTADLISAINTGYKPDQAFRIAHHGPDYLDPGGAGGIGEDIVLPLGPNSRQVIAEAQDLKITAIRMSHAPVEPAFGYRIDYKDRSISISGDTKFHEGFIAASDGVDIMFHEALDPEMVGTMAKALSKGGQDRMAKILSDTLTYHATPEDAARAAQQANADSLVYYHIIPPVPTRGLELVFLGDAAKEFRGPIRFSHDGTLYSLPANSNRIHKDQRF